jgi:RNA polymerase sigma factor (sigma-70 family)
MSENRQLLAEYVERGSEEAFRELVKRYINLVYSTAFRLVGGDRQSAEDVTQTVFLHLCRNAARLPREVMLGGWLHRDTCHVASNLLRGERRRRAREEQVVFMESIPDHTPGNLAAVAPILDEAINILNEEDRTAVLLRFFEQLDFRAVGAALGSTEDAARMRVSRALEKLQDLLRRRGVTLTAAALGTALASEAVTAAPVGLAATVSAVVLAGAEAAIGGTTILKFVSMTKIKAGIIGAIVVSGAAVPLWLQHQAQLAAREENRALHQRLDQLVAENERLSNEVAKVAGTPAAASEQERELLRLRGEVGGLKRQIAEAAQAQAKVAPIQQAKASEAMERQMELAISKMNYTKGWMIAFWQYAQQHGGLLPSDFESAVAFAPDAVKVETNLTTQQFEIVYKGLVNEITNPQSVIVIREKEAWQTIDGGWARGYSFADGHSEIHKAEDGNFVPWESQHLVQPSPAQAGQ